MTTPRPRTRRTNRTHERAPERAPRGGGGGPSRELSAIPSTLWILEPGQLARDAVIRHLQHWTSSPSPDGSPDGSPGGNDALPVLALTVTPTLDASPVSSPAASPFGAADTGRTDQAHRPTLSTVPDSGSDSGAGDGADAGSGRGPARPFWADMVAAATATAGPGRHLSLIPSPRSGSGVGEGSGGVSLLVVEHGSIEAGDDLGRRAAQLLAPGGLLAVLSQHRRSPDGQAGVLGALLDPTGSIVASAQNADLLYLQHIVLIARPPNALRAAAGATGSSCPASVPESLDATGEHIDLCLFLRPQSTNAVSGAAWSAGGDVPRAA